MPIANSADIHKKLSVKSSSQHINCFLLQHSATVLFSARRGLQLMLSFWISVLALTVAGCLVCRFKRASYASTQKRAGAHPHIFCWVRSRQDKHYVSQYTVLGEWSGLENTWKFKKKKRANAFFQKTNFNSRERKLLKIVSAQLPNKQAFKESKAV